MRAIQISVAGMLLAAAPSVLANNIRDAVTDLYGGDGITLQHTPIFDHSAHFTNQSLSRLSEFSNQAINLGSPLISVDTGSVFEYDPVVEDFVEVEGGLTSMFAERPESMGKGRFSVGFNYSDNQFSKFEGDDLDSITVNLGHLDVGGPGPDICIGGPPGACYTFELDVIEVEMDIDLQVQTFSVYADYGITDRLDIGIMIPVVRTEIDVEANARIIEHESAQFFPRTLHSFDPTGVDGDAANSRISRRSTGIGDVVLRSKYNLKREGKLRLGVAAQLRAPTGEYRDLQGTGRWGGRVAFLASRLVETNWGSVSPHLNLAYDVNNTPQGNEQAQLIAGADFGFRWFDRSASVSVDVLHQSYVARRDGVGDSLTDLALGFKWAMGSNGSFFVGARLPVDRNSGLRPDFSTELGGQFSF